VAAWRFQVAGATVPQRSRAAASIAAAVGSAPAASSAAVSAASVLFGYRAWRDTKLAIVMFVRERDLTTIVERAREALKGHPQFVEGRAAATDTELRRVVSWPGDDRRLPDLNVFFVHVPEP
jgi:hypothetical protein